MRVLAVGVATLDIVDLVERYPPEDAEVRALARAERRGGNAANTLAVLAQLGHEARWAGTVADDADARRLLERAAREGIDTTARVTHRDGCTPVSHVIASRATSSRTIVHYRQLPELEAADFARVPLQGVDWVHFEGRNVPALGAMLERVRDFGTRCSLEVEKPRDGIEALFPLPDVLLCARHYALARGHATAADLLAALPRRASQLLCCAWGADGAWAVGEDGALHHSPRSRRRCATPAWSRGRSAAPKGSPALVPCCPAGRRCAGWKTSTTRGRAGCRSACGTGRHPASWCAWARSCTPTGTRVPTPAPRSSGARTSFSTAAASSSSAPCTARSSRVTPASACTVPAPDAR